MAMSKGQLMADGHSHGSLGHGGQHRIGGHGTHVGQPGLSHDVNMNSSLGGGGHTPANQHGGTVPMGC